MPAKAASACPGGRRFVGACWIGAPSLCARSADAAAPPKKHLRARESLPPMSDGIIWPPRFAPDHCPVHVRNELAIAAAPERVWHWLVRAQDWPRWYANAADVRFLHGT